MNHSALSLAILYISEVHIRNYTILLFFSSALPLLFFLEAITFSFPLKICTKKKDPGVCPDPSREVVI